MVLGQEAKDCEIELLPFLQEVLAEFLDCPFSVLHWLKYKMALPFRFVVACEKVLEKLVECPSAHSKSAETLVGVAFLLVCDGQLGVSWWDLFGVSLKALEDLSRKLERELNPRPLAELVPLLTPQLQFEINIESIFSPEEERQLTRPPWRKNRSNPKEFFLLFRVFKNLSA